MLHRPVQSHRLAVPLDDEIARKTRGPVDVVPSIGIERRLLRCAVTIGVEPVLLDQHERVELVIGPVDPHRREVSGLVEDEFEGRVDEDMRMSEGHAGKRDRQGACGKEKARIHSA